MSGKTSPKELDEECSRLDKECTDLDEECTRLAEEVQTLTRELETQDDRWEVAWDKHCARGHKASGKELRAEKESDK